MAVSRYHKRRGRNSILLNGVDSRGMTFPGVGTQNIEEVGESRHCDRLVGLLVAKVFPVLLTSAAVPAHQFDIILREREPGSEQLFGADELSALTRTSG